MAEDRPAIEGGEPVRGDFLMFGSPLIEEPEIQEVVATLKSGWIGTGPKVTRFEELFRSYIGSAHAMALNSCSAGLHLSQLVLGIGPGDEVITTPLTFASTANTIIHTGATPVFADVQRDSMNIDPEQIERKITRKTKALIPVHLAGRPCDMDAVLEIARRRGLRVISDCAHAIEAEYKGRKVGGLGDLSAFSFYVTKNVITGEGGMVTTNNEEWADRIKVYALHGLSKDAWKRYSDEGYRHYEVVYPGYKYNMMDIQASLGIHQLPRIETYLKRRDEIWKRYNERFSDLPVILPAPVEDGVRHAHHLYTLLLDTDRLKIGRDGFQEALYRENIGTGIHFVSLHLHDYYRRTYGYRRGDFPHAEFISDRTVSLPLSPKLSDRDVEDVIRAVRKVLTYYSD